VSDATAGLTSDALSKLATDLREAAAAAGTLVAPEVPSIRDRQGGWMVVVGPDTALSMVKQLRLPVLYLGEDRFDLHEEVSDAIDSASFEDPADIASAYRSLRKRLKGWESRSGEVCSVVAAVVVGSVLHPLSETAGWYDEFASEVSEALSAFEEQLERKRNAETAKLDAEFEAQARELAAHKGFSEGRPSLAKRSVLARHLFPEASEGALERIVHVADGLAWLERATARG